MSCTVGEPRPTFGQRSAAALLFLIPLACREPEDDPPNADGEPPCELEFAEEVAPVLDYAAHYPCDPLDPSRKPFRVQPAVAVGRNPDGVLFVVDRIGQGTGSRVYTSVADNQLQWEVAPIAGISECDKDYCYDEYFFHSRPLRLVLRQERSPGRLEHLAPGDFVMGLLEDATGYASAREEFPLAVPLESLSECAVAEHEVIGEPLAVEEYITSDSNGDSLVVARDWGYFFQEIFVYYGPPGAVKQRELLKWARRRDGWTSVTFRVDDVEASAVFPVDCEARVGCPGELTLEGRRLALAASSKDPADLAGKTFLCATEVEP